MFLVYIDDGTNFRRNRDIFVKYSKTGSVLEYPIGVEGPILTFLGAGFSFTDPQILQRLFAPPATRPQSTLHPHYII